MSAPPRMHGFRPVALPSLTEELDAIEPTPVPYAGTAEGGPRQPFEIVHPGAPIAPDAPEPPAGRRLTYDDLVRRNNSMKALLSDARKQRDLWRAKAMAGSADEDAVTRYRRLQRKLDSTRATSELRRKRVEELVAEVAALARARDYWQDLALTFQRELESR